MAGCESEAGCESALRDRVTLMQPRVKYRMKMPLTDRVSVVGHALQVESALHPGETTAL
jgi:hypothetical protein